MKKKNEAFFLLHSIFELRTPLLVVFVLLLAACHTTTLPPGEELAPLTATSPADAARQLEARRAQFEGERSLVRLHLPSASVTVTARGQLQVDRAGHMLLTIYTPLGTSAARLYAGGDQIVYLNDLQSTAWQGKASDFAGGLGLFGNTMPTDAVADLLVGLPPPGMSSISYAATGMAEVRLPEVTITYDPPEYPPKTIRIERQGRAVEIDHLQSYADPGAVEPLTVPGGYRCCVLPRL